jgi:hypothetical protein
MGGTTISGLQRFLFRTGLLRHRRDCRHFLNVSKGPRHIQGWCSINEYINFGANSSETQMVRDTFANI